MSLNLREFLADLGYTDLRIVRGKVCGLAPRFDLATALVVGVGVDGCEAVCCYENECDARAALLAWSGEGHPPGPWFRLTGVIHGQRVDMRNPAFGPTVFARVARA